MLYQRGRVWWFKFRFAGRTYRESAKTSSKSLARDVERVRRREIEAAYSRVLHLLPKLKGRLLLDIDAHTIARYPRQRLTEGASPKSIDLEVGTLRALLRHHELCDPVSIYCGITNSATP